MSRRDPAPIYIPSKGRAEIFGIGDRAFPVDSESLRDLSEIDIRIGERRSHDSVFDAAIPLIAHALHVHQFHVVTTIVEHHAQQWNAMVCGRPQNARRIHQVTVRLQADGKPAVFLVREGRADR